MNEKSDEITAIPELLNTLLIKGKSLVSTLWAASKDIATCIIKGEGIDYLLAVKNNRASLYQNLDDSLRFLKTAHDYEDTDIGHGRIETRKCTIITDLAHIEHPDKWE